MKRQETITSTQFCLIKAEQNFSCCVILLYSRTSIQFDTPDSTIQGEVQCFLFIIFALSVYFTCSKFLSPES